MANKHKVDVQISLEVTIYYRDVFMAETKTSPQSGERIQYIHDGYNVATKDDELDLDLLIWKNFYIVRCKKQEIYIQDEHIFYTVDAGKQPYICLYEYVSKER